MSTDAASASGGGRAREGQGEESGLPLVLCPFCGKARVLERRSTKKNENLGRVYFKCPRGVGWREDKCAYFRWQREYLEELVQAKVVKVWDREIEEEMEQDYEAVKGQAQEGSNTMQRQNLEAKLQKLERLVYLLFVAFVGIMAMCVGYLLK